MHTYIHHSYIHTYMHTYIHTYIHAYIHSGRGTQLITGAEASKHKLLLFLHIDSQVPRHYDTMAWHTLFKPGVIAGAFQFGLDVVHEEEKK